MMSYQQFRWISYGLALGLTASVMSKPLLEPDTVEVFVTQFNRDRVVDVKPDARGMSVFVIDASLRFEDAINFDQSLPEFDVSKYEDEEYFDSYRQAVIPVVERLLEEWSPTLESSYKGTTLLLTYGIDELPAIVINKEFVAYGAEVSKAVKHWRQHIENQ